MLVWRLVRKRHLESTLTGEGARRFGGRWNSKGVAVIYTSATLELALLEALVHVDVDSLPRDYWQVCFELDDALIGELPKRLPKAWDAPPPYRRVVQSVGDRWVRSGVSLALRVPASVLPDRFNVLINPAHAAVARIREVKRERLVWPRRLIEHLASLPSGRADE